VSKLLIRSLTLLTGFSLLTGCNAYQPTKDVWKGTKSLWNTYISQPAVVNYDERGNLSPHTLALTNSMMGIDVELGRLERAMLNADRPPTHEWLSEFFAMFPWVSGFAGVKYDGTILGQEPAENLKQLDFVPLLYEDKKQSSRALRADVQPSPLGPEILLAAPLYDGTDFLGVVAVYFDMRTLMSFSDSPDEIVILSPQALLWPGKYDFAATPLSTINWADVVTKSSAGTCSNATGSFYYMVRYLGNLPLIFAVPETGSFPEGDRSLEQGYAFFPQEREKLSPPPQPERKTRADIATGPAFATDERVAQGEIQPGSQESMLLNAQQPKTAVVQERQLESEEKIPVKRKERPYQRRKIVHAPMPAVEQEPELPPPSSMERPSPFGPRRDEDAKPTFERPSPFGPGEEKPLDEKTIPPDASEPAVMAPEAAKKQALPESTEEVQEPAVLPGGRPSPFGPH